MRLIDKDALLHEYYKQPSYQHLCSVINAAPVIDLPSAQSEQKKGRWIKEYWNGEHTRKCSACKITQTVTTYRGKVNFNYCPYCGADMRGEQDE